MDEKGLKAWLCDESGTQARREYPYFTSHHIDEIASIKPHTVSDVDVGLAVLRVVERFRRELSLDLWAKLAIPFGDSLTLVTELPDLHNVPVTAPYEPPSLYLFAPRFIEVRQDREEYRCPYPAAPWGADIAAEYVCGRSMYERERGWEFGKTIWVSMLQAAHEADSSHARDTP